MRISGLQKTTLIDYPRKIACTIFLSGCNFRCGYCQNPELVIGSSKEEHSQKEILDFLEKRKKNLDGICITGGEPLLDLDSEFLEKIKSLDYSIKIDTNGSFPEKLEELIGKNLIDYVAMDVKGPEYLYQKIIGKEKFYFRDIERGIFATTQFPDYEFRTTVAPIMRNGKDIQFMTIGEIVDIAKWIIYVTGNNKHKYYLQPFVPRKGGLINPKFEEASETPREFLETIKKEVTKYLYNCEVRV